MKSNTTTILVAVGALLVGGVATAAFLKGGDKSPADQNGLVTAADGALVADDAAATDNQIPMGTLQYATVVKADPVTSPEKLYATVIGTEPVRETTTTSTPREVCEDVVVQERLPERDGNVGGTVAGAVIGGLLGNQVGSGSGKKAATVAGAVAARAATPAPDGRLSARGGSGLRCGGRRPGWSPVRRATGRCRTRCCPR